MTLVDVPQERLDELGATFAVSGEAGDCHAPMDYLDTMCQDKEGYSVRERERTKLTHWSQFAT